MEFFVDNRIRRYSIIMLTIVCVLFALFGYFVYQEGKSVQLQNFEEISLQYMDFVEKTIIEIKEEAKVKLELMRNHQDIINFLTQPAEVNYRYKSELLVYALLNDIDGLTNIKLTPLITPSKAYIMGKESLFDKDEMIVPMNYLDGSNCYASELRYGEKTAQFQTATLVLYDDQAIGRAYMVIDLYSILQEFTEYMTFKTTGQMLIYNEYGRLITHPKDEQQFSDEINLKGLDQSKISQIIIDDQDYFIKVSPIEITTSSTIYMIYQQSESELFAFDQKIIRSVVSIVIIFILAFALVVTLSGRYYSIQINEATEKTVIEKLDTEVEKQTKDLKLKAKLDSLTQLYNHGAMYKIIEKAIMERNTSMQALTLLMLDVDYFKDVNDQYGHQVGDQVLQYLAKLFVDNIRDFDVAGRYGGEEFIVLLKDTHLDLGYTVAERIRKAVMANPIGKDNVRITISIGICEWQGEDVASLIKKADKKLYDSKKYGRNKTTF